MWLLLLFLFFKKKLKKKNVSAPATHTLFFTYINGIKGVAALIGMQRAAHCGVTVGVKAQLYVACTRMRRRLNKHGCVHSKGDTLWQTPVIT